MFFFSKVSLFLWFRKYLSVDSCLRRRNLSRGSDVPLSSGFTCWTLAAIGRPRFAADVELRSGFFDLRSSLAREAGNTHTALAPGSSRSWGRPSPLCFKAASLLVFAQFTDNCFVVSECACVEAAGCVMVAQAVPSSSGYATARADVQPPALQDQPIPALSPGDASAAKP